MRTLEFPLLRRELLGLLRTRRAFWGIVAAVVASAAVPLYLWPESSDGALTAGSVPSLVAAFFITQLVIVLVVVPVFASQSISTERAAETWDSLLATRLSPTVIVLTKATVSLAFVVILLIATAPALVALQLLGGVTAEAILVCYAATATAALLAASCGLAAAAWAEKPTAALYESLIAVWSSTVMPWPFLLSVLLRTTTRFRQCMPHARHWRSSRRGKLRYIFNCFFLLVLSIAAFVTVCYHSFPQATGRSGVLGPFRLSPFALFYSLASGSGPGPSIEPFVLAVLSTVACQLAHVLVAANVGVLAMDESEKARELRKWGIKTDGPLVLAQRSWIARELLGMGRLGSGPASNPLFRRELQHERFGSSRYFKRSIGMALLLSNLSLLFLASTRSRVSAWPAYGLAACLVPALLATYWGAKAIPDERERGTMDLLRGTRLTAREVVQAKLRSTLGSVAGLVLGLSIFPTIFVLLFDFLFGQSVIARNLRLAKAPPLLLASAASLALAASATFYAAVASLLAGILARRTTTALTLGYILTLSPLAILALPPGPTARLESSGLFFALWLAVVAWILWLACLWIFERYWRAEP